LTMNILMLAPQPFFQQRGTPIAVQMLARALGEMGHQVDLLVYSEGEDVEIPGVTLHRTSRLPFVGNIPPGPSWKKFPCDLAMLFSALRLFRSKRFDLIHAVEEAAYIAMALKLGGRVPYVYDMDSSLAEQTMEKWKLPRFIGRLLEAMEGAAVRQSAGVLAVCKALEEKARAFAPGKLVARLEDVSLLGVDGSGPLLRNELELRGPLVMYVGNLERYQGIDLLLESFSKAAAGGTVADLVIIGGTTEHIEMYRRRASQLGIGERTHFTGPRPVEQLGWYLGQADVLVSPRTQGENTPMKIYSYLDSGRPVLATRLPTHTQVLDEEIAVLADPTPDSMGAALSMLIRDKALGDELARRAKERVSREHSVAAFQRKLRSFYDALEGKINERQLAAVNCSSGTQAR
jgi:glycosyltransferase involved in cell wall biosynthesis